MSALNPFMNRNDFIISVNGLSLGRTEFCAGADKEFFAKFDNEEILDADLEVTVLASKEVEKVDFDVKIAGTLTVTCDRCCSPVAMPVDVDAVFRLQLKGQGAASEDAPEEVFLPQGSDQLDLGQEIYDYSLLALPLQRFHSEGECDPVALACLSDGEPETAPQATDSPFSSLADMLKNKN